MGGCVLMVSTEVRCPVCSHPERVEWFWPRRVPKGKITILDGDPDNGKSVLTTDLAARKRWARTYPTVRRRRRAVQGEERRREEGVPALCYAFSASPTS